ncbi:signal peptidase [Acinetobacter sp. ANC 4169]|jgi:uncharacterized protein (DUF2147 family)|uniref:DUF2147 domain-containing protein n=1 Tax=Acinetobacter sp. ANC 4169 TaxID=1977879 RepID=UPI000A338276|nr:DUF2147 domain-containing protein [Acinetobacter sp. ANC 4169]OTG75179.1 signal peptidase [Acinetobacter sp. ANC 4169]
MKKNILLTALASLIFSGNVLAQDLSGTWQQIDDKTGSPKAIIEIRKDANDIYTGKIVKVTPRPGYTPQKTCNNCPAPYTNQPILGMDVLTGLKHVPDTTNYEKGRVIDPLAGKIYSAKVRLSPNGKRLTLRGYIGISAIGRSQTWLRLD